MADDLFPAAQAQPGPDTQEKFVSDLFFYLNAMQEAGTIKIHYPYSLDRDTVESHYLRRLSIGEFDDIRDLFLRVMDVTDSPVLTALWDRLERLSDQWDAALVYKVEPAIEFGPHRTRGTVQTYFELNGNLVPGEIAFKGTLKQCQNVLYGLEAGNLSMRKLRNSELGFIPPEPHFIYKMDADTDGQRFVQAFLLTKYAERLPGPVVFFGSEAVCADLAERLGCGALIQDDFFAVSEARESCYTTKDGAALDALVGPDGEVYLGRRDNHDGHGHYLNDDNSLIHISDTYRVFNLISGHDTPYSYDELHETRMFSEKEFARFMDLQLEGPERPHDHARETQQHFSQADAAPPATVRDAYPMPDRSIAPDALSVLGCSDDRLLPLSRHRAAELMKQDMTVYAVQAGKKPEKVFDRVNLLEQADGTVFAVSRKKWEASQDFRQAMAERVMNQPEDRKRREKKSVLARLSAPPPRREHKKSAPKKSAERGR